MPGGGGNHHHRPGALRQTNKKNKRSKSSKRSLSRAAGGKVSGGGAAARVCGRGGAVATMVAQSKADRKNRQQQKRRAKREEIMRKKRGGGRAGAERDVPMEGSSPPPRVVGIVSLGAGSVEERLRSFLLHGADLVCKPHSNERATVTCRFSGYKRDGNLTILTSQTSFAHSLVPDDGVYDDGDEDGAVLAALDLARVCDLLLVVIEGNGPAIGDEVTEIRVGGVGGHEERSTAASRKSALSSVGGAKCWDHLISKRGDKILTALKAQGLPTCVTVLAHTGKDGVAKNNGDDDDQMTMQSAKSLRRSRIKRLLGLRNYVGRFATTEFGNDNDKVVEVDLSSWSCSQSSAAGNGDVMAEEDSTTAARTASASASASVQQLVRTVCGTSAAPAGWVSRSPRPYILSDAISYDDRSRELRITGHVRGSPAGFDVHSLVHIPRVGTFACKNLRGATPPLSSPIRNSNNKNKGEERGAEAMEADGGSSGGIVTPDPELQESPDMFATPDALEGEQNLIGFEEDDGDDEQEASGEEGGDREREGFVRPAGWSDYQSAWLDAVDYECEDHQGGEGGRDRGELANQLNEKKGSAAGPASSSASLGEDGATTMDVDEDGDEATGDANERRALLERRRKDQAEHRDFPDEVQVDEDVNARERFARYRSLKSFRKSHWDPKENLPDSYATIYHIANFRATQRQVMNDINEIGRAADRIGGRFWGKTLSTVNNDSNNNCSADVSMDDNSDDDEEDLLKGRIPSGSYVTLTLGGIPQDSIRDINLGALLTAVSLLPHESKISVLHMGLARSPPSSTASDGSAPPVKSKDELTFRCGWRTWRARPVFSQNNLNCDKHKFERYLPESGGAFFAASVFGPVTYTPCPVLVFRDRRSAPPSGTAENADNPTTASSRGGGGMGGELIAVGSVMGADADRIVVKRIILTGYPVRVHKRYATVKYMFHNPDDVKWFRPAGLYTKHGLQGNIVQSIGEHGTMKCLFNAPIKQHDTVCLPLYKRIYPKFALAEKDAGKDNKTTVRCCKRNRLVVR